MYFCSQVWPKFCFLEKCCFNRELNFRLTSLPEKVLHTKEMSSFFAFNIWAGYAYRTRFRLRELEPGVQGNWVEKYA